MLSDLKEGKVTLPLIFALQRMLEARPMATETAIRSESRRLVAKVLEERGFLSVRPEQITKLVKDTGALARARISRRIM